MSAAADPRHHLLHAALVEHVESGRGSAPALHSNRRTLTYAELAAAVAEGAARIAESLAPDARVVVAARDQLGTALGFLAALASGRVPLLADPTSADGVRAIVERYAARAVVGESTLLEQVPAAVAIDVEATLAWGRGSRETLRLPAVRAREAAFWTFTSGTTGEPKAVVHGHAGPLAAHRAFAEGVVGLTAADRTIATGGLPFVYVLGNGLLFPLFAGASAILPRDLLLPTVLGELERHAATILVSGPWSLAALVRSTRRRGWHAALRRLRAVLSAGEALPATLFEDWRLAFGAAPLDNLGCTEMFNSFLSNRPDDARPGSLGRVVAGFEVRIDGRAPRAGARGSLSVRGESRAIAVGGGEGGAPAHPVARGWCDTGDHVEVERDGCIRFLGRCDDRLKIRGRFVHPVDVERRLLECTAVVEGMLTAEVDERGLPVLVARVVAAGDPADCAAEVLRQARRRLAAHEVPARVEVVEALPRSARGKLVRRRAGVALTAPGANG